MCIIFQEKSRIFSIHLICTSRVSNLSNLVAVMKNGQGRCISSQKLASWTLVDGKI